MNSRQWLEIALTAAVVGLGVYAWRQWQSGPAAAPSCPPAVTNTASRQETNAPPAKDARAAATNLATATPVKPLAPPPAETNKFCKLEGAVVHAWDNTPIGDAKVTGHTDQHHYTTNSGADGSFVLVNADGRPWRKLAAAARGFEEGSVSNIAKLAGANKTIADLRIALTPKWGDIEGKVINRLTGELVTNAVVSCLLFRTWETNNTARVNPTNGSFVLPFEGPALKREEFRLLRSTNFILVAVAEGFTSLMTGEDGYLVITRRQSTLGLIIALEPELTDEQKMGWLQGHVQYDDGSTATNVTFSLQSFNNPYAATPKKNPITDLRIKPDAFGNFWTNLPADVYRITRVEDKFLQSYVTVKRGETTPLRLTVPSPGILRLNFLDDAGQAYLLGCRLRIGCGKSAITNTIKAGDSSYTLNTIVFSNYMFYAIGKDDSTAGPYVIEVAARRQQAFDVILKKSTLAMTGSVVNVRDRSPVAKAALDVTIMGMEHPLPLPRVETGSNGEFSVSLPEGNGYVVRYDVRHGDYAPTGGTFAVTSGANVEPLNISLNKYVALEVRIFGLESLPYGTNATIRVKTSGVNGGILPGILLPDLVKQRGLVRLGQQLEGKVDLEVIADRRNGAAGPKVLAKKTIELTNAETNRLEIQVWNVP